MSWLKRLADRLILWPTVNPIDAGDRQRELISVSGGHLEAWRIQYGDQAAKHKILLVKFPGNGGRAEYSTPNPAHLWDDVWAEVWTINPFGYGGSTGPATLQRYPEMVDEVYKTLRSRFPDYRLVVYGNSLGSLSALSMAAAYEVEGVYLRNPVPIHQLVSTRPRYAWPSLGTSRFIAMQIPKSLDAVENAGKASAPCLVVTSEQDRLVPPSYQAMIIENYGGPKRVFRIPDADHHDSIPEELGDLYRQDIDWLLEQLS